MSLLKFESKDFEHDGWFKQIIGTNEVVSVNDAVAKANAKFNRWLENVDAIKFHNTREFQKICEHEGIEYNSPKNMRGFHCLKCGIELKAKWEVVE